MPESLSHACRLTALLFPVRRAKPLAVINRINITIADVSAGVDTLLSKASREELLPIYSEVKGLVCCLVPDVFASMWTGLTFAGGAFTPVLV